MMYKIWLLAWIEPERDSNYNVETWYTRHKQKKKLNGGLGNGGLQTRITPSSQLDFPSATT